MTSLRTGSLRLATSATLLVLLSASVRAGDEDISPSPYQEFDPVTGYMVTIDPAEERPQGHGPAAAETDAQQPAEQAGDGSSVSWLHAGVAVAAIIAVTGLLRRRRRAQAATGH